jgi:hypothetical protein
VNLIFRVISIFSPIREPVTGSVFPALKLIVYVPGFAPNVNFVEDGEDIYAFLQIFTCKTPIRAIGGSAFSPKDV